MSKLINVISTLRNSNYNINLLLEIQYTTKHSSYMILVKEKEAVNDQSEHFYATGSYYPYMNIQ